MKIIISVIVLVIGTLTHEIVVKVRMSEENPSAFRPTVVSWSPNGEYIAVGEAPSVCNSRSSEPNKLRILDADTLQLKNIVPDMGECGILDLSWRPTSTQLAFAQANDRAISIWDMANEQVVPDVYFRGQLIESVHWSPDGNYIAFTDISGATKIGDPNTGQILQQLFTTSFYADWNQEGTQLVTASGNRLVFFEMQTYSEIVTVEHNPTYITELDWSSSGTVIASYHVDNSIQILDANSKQIMSTIPTLAYLTDVKLSPDGTKVAGVDPKNALNIWDTGSGELLTIIEQLGIYGVSWCPDGSKLVYVGDFEEEIRIIDFSVAAD